MRGFGLFLFVLIFSMATAWADAPKPFAADTPAAVAKRFAGKPYVLAFWSVDCPHCQGELALIARLLRERPDLPVLLVSVDPPDLSPQVSARLTELGLIQANNWQFADARAERLRFVIDRQWRGELPRSYLFAGGRQVQVISGALSEAVLRQWLGMISGQ